MAAPSMSGTELAGRLFALESLVIALAAQVLTKEPEDRVQAVFAGVKELSQALIDDLTPSIGATPAVVKDLETHSAAYIDSNIDAISRMRTRLLKAQAAK